MTIVQQGSESELTDDSSRLWITRCAVPTSVGLAVHHGWFEDEFAPDGLRVDYLPYLTSPEAQRRHYDHELTTLLREGGNIPALWTRSKGEPTRLIGLTWIDERQVIVGRSDTEVASPADLKGKRLGIPRRGDESVDVFRGMALRGFAGVLASAGLELDDATLVDVRPGDAAGGLANQWDPDFGALVRGEVDVIYAKGAVAVDAVSRYGARVVIELDRDVAAEFRINNGTPRPITAHQGLLDTRPEVVERFLSVLLNAARWGRQHPEEITSVLAEETGADLQGAAGAYSENSLAGFEPTLEPERVSFLARQKDFLLAHGFLVGDFDIDQWVDEKPLLAAHDRLVRTEGT
jgi:ABC-type nitrate/sulfonate/bicarbonate transport system substrate-binding protein